MTLSLVERHRLAVVGWLATVGTSFALFTALQEKRFLLVAALLSGIVVGVGMVLRQLRVPGLLVPVVQLLVAAELLIVGYAHGTRYGVPTAVSFDHLQQLYASGLDVAQRYAAPVPPTAGLSMLTVGFITLIAIAVDLLAAGLARAPLAGIPLLALYAVPVASLPSGVPAVCFIPGAIGYVSLLMLSERERLAHWGRHVARSTHGATEVVDTSGLASTGRRISFAAISAAVVLPILIPTFTADLIHGRGGLGGNGAGSLNLSDPMVSLATSLHRKDPVDLVDVTASSVPTYVRLAVLDEPDPNAWRNSGAGLVGSLPAESFLPAPVGLAPSVARRTASMNVSLESDFPRDSVWLPVPDDLSGLSFSGFPGDFGFVPSESTVTSTSEDSLQHVSTYLATYTVPEFTPAELEHATPAPADIVTRFSVVPSGVPAVVSDVAHRVTDGLGSDYAKALALQSFFRDRGNFTYDLNAGYGDGYRAMAAFLQKRRGYCQHFAATMAMMARTLGIPSRVVVGFLAPSKTDGPHQYVFTSNDAHAWPELYFGGVGWVKFEPTPGNGAVPPPYTHQVQVPTVNPTQGGDTTAPLPGGGKISDEVPTTSAAVVPHRHGRGSSGGGSLPSAWWLVLVLAVALSLTPGLIRIAVRRSRLARAIDGGPSSEHAWLELRDRIVDLRLPWTGALTPRARHRYIEPMLGGDPDGVAALDRLSLTVERARYASTPLAGARPGDDARAIMAAIDDGVGRRQRLLAFLWPSSLMPEVRGSISRLRTALRRRLTPRPASSQTSA